MDNQDNKKVPDVPAPGTEDNFSSNVEEENNTITNILPQQSPIINFACILALILTLRQWVCHKNKVPHNPLTGQYADVTDQSTWTSYDEAVQACNNSNYDGIGFVFNGNGIVGIDLDHVRDPQTGEIAKWATEAVEYLNSYTEISPSGTGLHIYTKGTSPGSKHKIVVDKNLNQILEIYDDKRFFTFTGNVLRNVPIRDATKELADIYNYYFPPQPPVVAPALPAVSATSTIQPGKDYLAEGLSKNKKLRDLYDGNRQFKDESANDMALMGKLAYWCNKDANAMITAFLASKHYDTKDQTHKDKCQRPDYLLRTADRAIQSCTVTAADKFKPEDFTDTGNAKLFAQYAEGKAIFSKSIGWLLWTGTHWLNDDYGIFPLAIEFTELMKNKAFQELDIANNDTTNSAKARQEAAKDFLSHALKSRNKPKLQALIEIAKSLLYKDLDELDPYPFLLNTPAGMVNLSTGKMFPHDPNALCTKITKFAPDAKGMQLWQDNLMQVGCGDVAWVDYLQQIAGMAAIGQVSTESIVMAYGGGRNGKSSTFNTMAEALGDYAGYINPEILTTRKQNKGPDKAELRGKRLVILPELEEGRYLSSSMLKQLTSTDRITAERKYKDPESFVPSHTSTIYTNYLPKLSSLDDGTKRRISVIPFNAKFDGALEVKNFAQVLVNEAGGAILAWIIEGAMKFIANGSKLNPPQSVINATANYINENDLIANFLDEKCILDPSGEIASSDLYNHYKDFCDKTNEKPKSINMFVKELENKGFQKQRTNKGSVWKGIAINLNS